MFCGNDVEFSYKDSSSVNSFFKRRTLNLGQTTVDSPLTKIQATGTQASASC